jgi:hypothetical protein
MLTLASDFGSPYPAAMRGVLCSELAPDPPRLVDVAHDLPRGDVRAAAFWLRFVLPEFPPAVHLAVVDPGVGTDRDALLVRAGEHVLVGPDNGSLLPPARALARTGRGGGADDAGDDGPTTDAADQPVEAYRLAYDAPASATFHGRDVFAPAAAAAHRAVAADGWTPTAVASLDGVAPTDPVDLRLPDPDVDRAAGRATGEVLVVDDFGNVVTNLPGAVLDGVPAVTVLGGDAVEDGAAGDVGDAAAADPVPVVDTFAEVPRGARLVTVGSHGNVELDVNDGRGDEAFGLAPRDRVVLTFDGTDG